MTANRQVRRTAECRAGAAIIRRPDGSLLLTICLLLSLSIGPGSRSLAQTGTGHMLPGPGLNLLVETTWPDGAGYRPVRVTVTPAMPVAADRTLAFEFTTFEYYGGGPSRIRVAQDIEIPAGSGPLTATILVPYLSGHNNYEFEVGENGRAIPGMKGSGSFQTFAVEERFPRILAVGPQTPNAANVGRVFISANQYGSDVMAYTYQSPNSPTPNVYSLPTLQSIALSDLGDRWLDYSALDLIAISLEDLQRLRRGQPAVLDAIVAWTAAGGNLLVSGVGPWQRVKDLESAIGFPPGQQPREGEPPADWTRPSRGNWGRPMRGIGDDVLGPFDPIPDSRQPRPYETIGPDGQLIQAQSVPPQSKSQPDSKPVARTPPKTDPFVTRPLEMGTLIAVVSDKPFDESPAFWAWLFNDLSSAKALWYQRHGLSQHYDNPEFYRFLIPGVGQPPLNAFRVLITLFVVGIGPVNYFVLRRWRRLHLLIVTVPASAAVVTAALFAYAFYTDGLRTRVRARSVTRINQSTGRTECWCRLSYYCGMAPGRGLRFSNDTAVYPLLAVPGEGTTTQRELTWYGDQRMTSGWLRSRTPAQFLTVRSRETNLKLGVGTPAKGRLPIENGLAVEIQDILIRDADGSFYSAESLQPGQKTEAKAAGSEAALAQIQAAIRACEMPYPPGMSNPATAYRARRRWYSSNAPVPGPDQKTSVLEKTIGEVLRSNSTTSLLPRRSYLAVAAAGPEVELGTPLAEPEASVHLIWGTW